jgi:hypothetical protein
MCLIYGLALWYMHGGKLLIILHPLPHVAVISKGYMWHGTTKGTGEWHIEKRKAESFFKYLAREV